MVLSSLRQYSKILFDLPERFNRERISKHSASAKFNLQPWQLPEQEVHSIFYIALPKDVAHP